MQRLRYVLPIMMAVILLLPSALMAQEVSSTISLLDALAIVQDSYGTDTVVIEASYNAENACWAFQLEDGTQFCVDEVTGEILLDNSAEMTPEPESTPDLEATPDVESTPEAESTPETESTPEAQDSVEALTPVVSMEDAIAIALTVYPDSTISNINLEQLDGMLVWDVELDDGVRSVDVDALTGAVLSFGYEANDDNSYLNNPTAAPSSDSVSSDSGSSNHNDDNHNDDHESDDSHNDD